MTTKERMKSLAEEFVWFATSLAMRDSITNNTIHLFHTLEKHGLFDGVMGSPLFNQSTVRILLELLDDLLSDFTRSSTCAGIATKDLQTYFNILIQIRGHVANFCFSE